jgi:hypothetical protein
MINAPGALERLIILSYRQEHLEGLDQERKPSLKPERDLCVFRFVLPDFKGLASLRRACLLAAR